eukprot:TRINITY_DN35245_c0_g1_i1.p1 TRINITY_DN35245_c0_g1~~TRINITY_DN35245_c0_g1_i1.p1  ORF type:complete len:1099 (-),score=207.38 TRINITY_DN35245_c0_g1_i1:48-3344(-)
MPPAQALPVGGDVHSWGSGEMGQLGFPLLEDLPKDQDGYPYEPTAGLIKAFKRMKICQIAGGDGHTAAVTVHGKLYSWGASACGQLGHCDTEHMPKDVEGYPYQPVPLLVSSIQDVCIVQIACGDAHTVALSREGALYSWGGGGCGQLGHSETSKMPKDEDGCPYQLTPRVVDHLRPHVVSTIACGKAHTIAVSDRGRMFTWGAGACGQLGHPDTSSFPSDEDGYPFQPVPREVEHLREYRVVATACGDVHTLALSDEGHVYSFGGGSYGQLGVKDVLAMPVDADNCPYMPTPQRVSGLEGIVRLACGDSHSLTVGREGRLYCWGANSCGQLGIMNPDDPRIRKDPDGIPHLPTPVELEALADQRIVDIACGEAHSLAVSASGNLYSWGACSCGQLGLGSCEGMPVDSDGYPYQPTPTLVTAGFRGKAVLKVACGGVHNLAITEPDQSLASSLATLVNSEMLADVCFRSSEGSIIFAHLCIFKHNAPQLHSFVLAQIEGKVASSIAADGDREIAMVNMPNARMEVLLDFMQYVYTLDINVATMSLSSFAAVLELYHLGDRFSLTSLLPKCRRLIRQQLGKQNLHKPGLMSMLSPRPSMGTAVHNAWLSSKDPVSDVLDDEPAPLHASPGQGDWPASSGDGWGIFFLPSGQALVLDEAAYRETLSRGTLLDLQDIEAPIKDEDSSLLEEHMRLLLADKDSCDVFLAAGLDSEDVGAHKCVLASRSSYFRALFSSEFRERSQSRVLLEDITPDQLALLINFIYADDWVVEDAEFAFDMIPIADRFSVLDLKRLCERTLICAMSVENVARIFSLADRYACSRARSRALLFMTDSAHFHLVMKTASFAELDKVLILEILHSHKMAPVPAPLPSEPLPGNSATLSKAGQSKMRDHRHARGGGAGSGPAGSAGTARSLSMAASAAATSASGASSSGNVLGRAGNLLAGSMSSGGAVSSSCGSGVPPATAASPNDAGAAGNGSSPDPSDSARGRGGEVAGIASNSSTQLSSSAVVRGAPASATLRGGVSVAESSLGAGTTGGADTMGGAGGSVLVGSPRRRPVSNEVPPPPAPPDDVLLLGVSSDAGADVLSPSGSSRFFELGPG